VSIETVLTGITTTGTPHLGNYIGAILPAIEASRREDVKSYYFLADYHALVKCQDPERLKQSTLEVAAAWLAAGLDTEQSVFYRQSDIPEVMELNWILACMTAKGLMNRAHAYKAAVAENEARQEKDSDQGISMGLFCYPILMAADILLFNANKVPVGKDQIQHLEMTRDIAARFNYHYGEHLTLPEAVVDENAAVLPGLDGRKMSKSYDNTIPLFVPEDQLRKLILRIRTNSQPPGDPKDTNTCTLFAIYQAFASEKEVIAMRKRYAEGIGWGEMKQILLEHLNAQLTAPRERYEALLRSPDYIEKILTEGAIKAREYSVPFMQRIRRAIGICALSI
jgi:tryptophanyl-tRNA synthetase